MASEHDEIEDEDTGDPTSKTALVPVREQTVEFYGDLVPVAQTPEGDVYVPLRPLTDFLGLAFGPQRRRVLRDKVLAGRAQLVVMAGSSGRRREMFCLPLDLLPGWLFGVSPSQARPELEEKLHRYRTDCFRVLWNAVKGEALATRQPYGELSGAALALEIATAVQHLAQQQLEMETHLSQVAGRQEVMAEYLRGFIQRTDQRLHNLELHLNTGAIVSETQAAEIALAVKNVGQRLVAQGDKNGYARVYSEMYRKYGIASYRNLPSARFKDVLVWLHEWYKELKGNTE